MTWHVHDLRGCSPTPLARYLKALGVLRAVSEQIDPGARGFWRNDSFRLATRLTIDELVDFFVKGWAPTPIVTPWNKDGGFLGESATTAKAVVAAKTLDGKGSRFDRYLEGVQAASDSVAGREDSPKDEEKLAVFSHARAEWSEAALDWLDAVVALLPEEDKPRYPSLLASGGCDGRFDFGSAFRNRVVRFFGGGKEGASPDVVRSWLRAALLGTTEAQLPGDGGGQLDPGSTSPVNGGTGFRGLSAVNPWDFVLAFEGTPVLRVAVARRLKADKVLASAPFTVRGNSAGYPSASAKDEEGRGEQWVPLWANASTLGEVRALFAEGRMLTGSKSASSAVDAGKAIARLGVARGITSFERYSYVPRNGQSTLAVPLGRWTVARNPHVRLLDEIEGWVDRLRMAGRAKGAPASLVRDARRIESAMLEVCRAGTTPERWQDLITLLGEAEHNLGARSKSTAEARLQPLPALSLEWLQVAEDGSAEFRTATAIGLLGLPPEPVDRVRRVLGPLRMHALPLQMDRNWTTFATAEAGLAKDPRVIWTGHDLASDLAAVVARRALEGERVGAEGFALDGPVPVGLADIEAFLRGGLDDRKIARLARGLMALRRPTASEAGEISRRLGRPRAPVQPLFAIARLTHLSRPLGVLEPRVDPTLSRLLLAGRLDEAMTLGLRRLRASGLAPKLRLGTGSYDHALRIAAAIALPLADVELARILDVVTKPSAALEGD